VESYIVTRTRGKFTTTFEVSKFTVSGSIHMKNDLLLNSCKLCLNLEKC
jgi:hypothetical protein